ncbi:hypothetical protein [Shimwellia blattae]|uniref:DNA utilization protein HofO C-terminal domain-containing protein n=1 Tax=Shimwellia blattae (strain ATCC 29907 / DSM 4481 / JCM 1650 / NBRC 105725 / CDC 9005-74) TaxID=630626 RepID=I2B4B8_SHIBC|nr:hypothetical protein [Shimwellia blattae]AFJ45372.1 hypothetical protein EBL_c02370 [Shimwellia blattae DSM 4481 = NBRC 105725]GAB82859.1 putative DNA utilization protein HofO [Shimwellia blattae DSM 4481 = NBRC 105725]VDY62854.1 Uncharacterised protein [Shimwellia blattae]VEC19762.1 Uncharacterised protein [Shimwellia blattae]
MRPLAERRGLWAGVWLVSLLVALLVVGWLYRDTARHHQALARVSLTFDQAYRVQQKRLLALSVPLPEIPPARPALPVLAFAAACGGELIAWQPEADGGPALTLALPWSRVPPLFSQLAGYAVTLRGFSLSARPDDVLLVLALTPEAE